MKKLIAGNWKMNCNLQDAKELIADVINGIHMRMDLLERNEFLVCPPYIYLPTIRHAALNHNLLSFGAQDCSHMDNGAHTGDISASMLYDSDCQYVITGHSERRADHAESDTDIAAKVVQIQKNKMVAILCVGENEDQRDRGEHVHIVISQLEASLNDDCNAQNLVVAYEPIWAIGTGKTASSKDIEEMHGVIRKKLQERLADGQNIRILYGGSVKPENAGEILNLPGVGGALIGGASLKASSFIGIAEAV